MKYVFIENHQAELHIKTMCRVLRVARSGWYAWRLRRHQLNQRQQFRLACDAAVSKAFTEAKQRYGAPRLADELPEYNVKTIAASLRCQGLRAKASRKFSAVSYRAHALPVSENLLKQDFYASGPNQKRQEISRTVCPEFRVSWDAQMNHESVWNIEQVTYDEKPNNPTGCDGGEPERQ